MTKQKIEIKTFLLIMLFTVFATMLFAADAVDVDTGADVALSKIIFIKDSKTYTSTTITGSKGVINVDSVSIGTLTGDINKEHLDYYIDPIENIIVDDKPITQKLSIYKKEAGGAQAKKAYKTYDITLIPGTPPPSDPNVNRAELKSAQFSTLDINGKQTSPRLYSCQIDQRTDIIYAYVPAGLDFAGGLSLNLVPMELKKNASAVVKDSGSLKKLKAGINLIPDAVEVTSADKKNIVDYSLCVVIPNSPLAAGAGTGYVLQEFYSGTIQVPPFGRTSIADYEAISDVELGCAISYPYMALAYRYVHEADPTTSTAHLRIYYIGDIANPCLLAEYDLNEAESKGLIYSISVSMCRKNDGGIWIVALGIQKMENTRYMFQKIISIQTATAKGLTSPIQASPAYHYINPVHVNYFENISLKIVNNEGRIFGTVGIGLQNSWDLYLANLSSGGVFNFINQSISPGEAGRAPSVSMDKNLNIISLFSSHIDDTASFLDPRHFRYGTTIVDSPDIKNFISDPQITMSSYDSDYVIDNMKVAYLNPTAECPRSEYYSYPIIINSVIYDNGLFSSNYKNTNLIRYGTLSGISGGLVGCKSEIDNINVAGIAADCGIVLKCFGESTEDSKDHDNVNFSIGAGFASKPGIFGSLPVPIIKGKYIASLSDITGLYIDQVSQTLVYVGYEEPTDVGGNNISFLPDVPLPLPVPPAYPGWGDISPIKCYKVEPGYIITGFPNRWCIRANVEYGLKAFAYQMFKNPNNMNILVQGACDFSGMPEPKSVSWWEKPKTLTQLKDVKIPDDIASISGLYVDKASQKIVYVGDPTNVGNSIIFIPDVLLPIPAPPAYPRWGDITPVKCYNLESGYTLSGTRGLNRWSNGSNKLFLKKFSYYVTEDLNGNTMLIQGDCDFSGVPPSESVTWWKNAKVLIKK